MFAIVLGKELPLDLTITIRPTFDYEKANDYAERTSRSSYYVIERFSRDFYTKKRKGRKKGGSSFFVRVENNFALDF